MHLCTICNRHTINGRYDDDDDDYHVSNNYCSAVQYTLSKQKEEIVTNYIIKQEQQ